MNEGYVRPCLCYVLRVHVHTYTMYGGECIRTSIPKGGFGFGCLPVYTNMISFQESPYEGFFYSQTRSCGVGSSSVTFLRNQLSLGWT